MKLKNSAIQSVGSIIKAPTGNRKLKLRVTFYQRPYQWSQNLIQKLFHDYFVSAILNWRKYDFLVCHRTDTYNVTDDRKEKALKYLSWQITSRPWLKPWKL